MNNNIILFQGIKFYNLSPSHLIKKITKEGGYLVAPAASSLSKIFKNNAYHQSLQKSAIAILDSGFFCILLRIFSKYKKITKLSGYLFLKNFIDTAYVKNKKILLIDPSKADASTNQNLLKSKKFKKIYNYIAPQYTKRSIKNDLKLIKLLKKVNPKYILINIGGEKQEVLAQYICKKYKKKFSILCLGAAISFLTKKQASINKFEDKYYLGWLKRFLFAPRIYYKRIIDSFFLVNVFFRN